VTGLLPLVQGILEGQQERPHPRHPQGSHRYGIPPPDANLPDVKAPAQLSLTYLWHRAGVEISGD